MDEHRLAEFLGSKSGTAVDVRSVRRVALRPTRAIFDVDTTSGPFAVHVKVDGSAGPAPDTEFALMNSLAETGFPIAAPTTWQALQKGIRPDAFTVARPFGEPARKPVRASSGKKQADRLSRKR